MHQMHLLPYHLSDERRCQMRREAVRWHVPPRGASSGRRPWWWHEAFLKTKVEINNHMPPGLANFFSSLQILLQQHIFRTTWWLVGR